ncbi:MAG: hypothetical protein ACRETL_04960, partial [Gammaproteobacteria bacterium]
VELWLSFIYAGYNGAMVVHLTEIVPVAVRTAGFSLAYSLATTIGGSTPAIVTYLIHETGNRAIPGAWLSMAAAIAFLISWLSRSPIDERRRPADISSNEGTHGDELDTG